MIDWFVVLAQVVNFLVLVALLRLFLYGPIVAAMTQRQQSITSRLEEAKQKKQEAAAELNRYQNKIKELEEARESKLSQMKDEVEQHRKEMLRKSREEIELQRARWNEALEQEMNSFLRELRLQLARGVCSVARRALAELANAELEEQVTQVFLQRLKRLSPEDRHLLRSAVKDSHNALAVDSAFDMPASLRQTVVDSLQEILPDSAEVRFGTNPGLVCGIELNAGGYKMAWETSSYLESLEAELVEQVDHRAKQSEPGVPEDRPEEQLQVAGTQRNDEA